MGGCLQKCFVPGDLSKIGELLMNNSFSVEQAFIYFTLLAFQNKYYWLLNHLLSAVC